MVLTSLPNPFLFLLIFYKDLSFLQLQILVI